MYHRVTCSIKKFKAPSFWRNDFPACLLVFAASLLPVRSLLRTVPRAILISRTGGLPEQQVAAVRPRCTGRDFDAIFRAAWLILPWTSQAACGSSQTFFHPFSRYYMSRASLSRCVTCTTVIHTDFWELVVRVLWEARTCSRQNRHDRDEYPFAGMASEHRLDNFKPDTQVIE